MNRPTIFVAGHNGMVGSAIVRALKSRNDCNILTSNRDILDLCNSQDVNNFFSSHQIDQVYLAAAKVGGIGANNNYPTEFIFENLQIQNNVIYASHKYNIDKLIFLGSSCIYPRLAPQPIKEEYLLSGILEPTNEPYAIAKIAGIKLCESINRQYHRMYRSIMPTNLYGPGDNYHLENSHVIPALIRKFHDAKSNNLPHVTVWGTGEPRREFLHVDDLAYAAIHIMNLNTNTYNALTMKNCSHINVGCGSDIKISDLAKIISSITEYKGQIFFDHTKPDGTPRKLLDCTKINSTGWTPTIQLQDGILNTYKNFIEQKSCRL